MENHHGINPCTGDVFYSLSEKHLSWRKQKSLWLEFTERMHDKSLKVGLSANSAVHWCHSLRIWVALPLQHPSTYSKFRVPPWGDMWMLINFLEIFTLKPNIFWNGLVANTSENNPSKCTIHVLRSQPRVPSTETFCRTRWPEKRDINTEQNISRIFIW